jgi:hypothetical protein
MYLSFLAAFLLLGFQTVFGQYSAHSPPYYPSPQIDGSGDWKEAYVKAKAFVDQLTILEKVNLTTGTGWSMDNCVGNVGSWNSFPRCASVASC